MKNKIFLKRFTISFFLLLSFSASFAQLVEKQPAPNFTLSDINGTKISLSDFKGKIIYLDFWATWCGPCQAEIPYSRNLQETFKENPNIVFINISFDQDTKKWQKVVRAKKMMGTQLISINGKESDVITSYNVKTIPRFIIIDKNGLILDADAKRPSEKGLTEYLTKILSE
ncbi:MAG TPA: TlpA disulfide reductase family protein [Cytophagaceae bacterium]|nr:TlpA disulfide reductase family protein [Cytophagaceae bacterium]